jgi:hypothetical protein
MKLKRNGFAVTALLGLLTIVVVPRANATAELVLSDGTTTVTVTDGGVGDLCAAANCVTFSGAVGNWNINVTTGDDKAASAPLLMDLNSIDHHNALDSTTLTIDFTDNGFTPASTGFDLQIGGTIGAGGTLSSQFFGGNSNTLLDKSTQLGATMNFTAGAFSGTQGVSTSTVNPYSLTEQVQLSFGAAAGQTSFDYSVGQVPEPGSVVLFGSVLLFAVGAIRRKTVRG